MGNDRKFYLVASKVDNALLQEHLWYGYESRQDFHDALYDIVTLWKDRIGECIDERHKGDFLRLRFHDTPGGKPDEAWLPRLILQPVPIPDYVKEMEAEKDPFERDLDEAFGFD